MKPKSVRRYQSDGLIYELSPGKTTCMDLTTGDMNGPRVLSLCQAFNPGPAFNVYHAGLYLDPRCLGRKG